VDSGFGPAELGNQSLISTVMSRVWPHRLGEVSQACQAGQFFGRGSDPPSAWAAYWTPLLSAIPFGFAALVLVGSLLVDSYVLPKWQREMSTSAFEAEVRAEAQSFAQDHGDLQDAGTFPSKDMAKPASASMPTWVLKAIQLFNSCSMACIWTFRSVYLAALGLSPMEIGIVSMIHPITQLSGMVLFAVIIDFMQNFKVVLVATNVIGAIAVGFFVAYARHLEFVYVVALFGTYSFLLSTSTGVMDALCLKVLEENKQRKEFYGDQRLWFSFGMGGMSLLLSALMGPLGADVLFYMFFIMQGILIAIICIYMPASKHRRLPTSTRGGFSKLKPLLRFDVLWFFGNLLVYGFAMSLIELYTFLFVLSDFDGAPCMILGCMMAVMVLFEIPVFHYIGPLLERSLASINGVLAFCHVVLAIRCLLYCLMPRTQPWLVLLVEPLHGITFAAMWSVTVAYGKALAPPGMETTMQAILSGIYNCAGFSIGGLVWAKIVTDIGFKGSYMANSFMTMTWLALWSLGVSWSRGSRAPSTASGVGQSLC